MPSYGIGDVDVPTRMRVWDSHACGVVDVASDADYLAPQALCLDDGHFLDRRDLACRREFIDVPLDVDTEAALGNLTFFYFITRVSYG